MTEWTTDQAFGAGLAIGVMVYAVVDAALTWRSAKRERQALAAAQVQRQQIERDQEHFARLWRKDAGLG